MDKLQFTINETLITYQTYRQSLCLRIIYNHMYTIATINLSVLFGAVTYILMHANKIDIGIPPWLQNQRVQERKICPTGK